MGPSVREATIKERVPRSISTRYLYVRELSLSDTEVAGASIVGISLG